MSYGIYVGRDLTLDGNAWLAGYGDEPSSHWLEITPSTKNKLGKSITVGVSESADMPGKRIKIPQAPYTYRFISVNYSYYKGVPAPITNGGLNEHGVAVRDIWSTSRPELIEMTPKTQTGLNYSDLARLVLERAKTAKEGVVLIGSLIAEYGESSYGGNSHLIADANEAWVVIQFSGGQGLWAAERLGSKSIRVSRPGYIENIPVDDPGNKNFLYSPNLVSFCKEKGWYSTGTFNVNKILGDGKGRWEGVKWMENSFQSMIVEGKKISFKEIVWALRTSKLTGDTAGYGQIVPLLKKSYSTSRFLWHAPIGAIASTFSPVFIGQDHVPSEFARHRYLTAGEAHRFMDNRKIENGEIDSVSLVSQEIESSRSAVMECKRLLYLILQDPERYKSEVSEVFEKREIELFGSTRELLKLVDILLTQDQLDLAEKAMTYFSNNELRIGLNLIMSLSDSIEKRLRFLGKPKASEPRKFDQIW
jgi:hypothetical protein